MFGRARATAISVLTSSLLGSLWINIAGLGSSADWLAEEPGRMVFLYCLSAGLALIVVGVATLAAGIPSAAIARKFAPSPAAGLLVFGLAAWFMANLVERLLSPIFTGLTGWVTMPYAAIAALTFWAVFYGLFGSSRSART